MGDELNSSSLERDVEMGTKSHDGPISLILWAMAGYFPRSGAVS